MTALRRLATDRYAPRWQSITLAGLYVLAAITVGMLVNSLVQWRNAIDDGETFQRVSAGARARSAADAMTAELTEFALSVREAARAIENSPSPRETIKQRLDTFVLAERNVMRAGALFTPADESRFAPFSSHRPDPLDPLILERGVEDFDYSAHSPDQIRGLENPERYLHPFEEGAAWARPYYDPEFDSVVVEFGVRFVGSEEANSGVFYAQIKVETVTRNVSWSAFRESGYGFILSRDGAYLAHPLDEKVSIEEQLPDGLSGPLAIVLAGGSSGVSGFVDYDDELGSGDSWIAFEPVAPVGWTLGHVVVKDQVLVRTGAVQRALMQATAAAIAVLFFVIVILSRAYSGNPRGLWVASLTMSIMFVVGIGYFWFLEKDTPERRLPNQLNEEAISAFEDAVFEEFGFFANRALMGATIESVTFITVDTAIVTGRMWQKLDNLAITNEAGTGGDVIPKEGALPVLRTGFLFPQNVTLQKLFGRTQGSNGQFAWTYEAVMTLDLDLGKYPFDTATVSVPLEQSDFGRAVISVPDLDSYDELAPDDRPGLRGDISIVGWTPEEAFFDYRPGNFESDLGLLQPIGTRSQPELSYNLRMSRGTIGPMVTNMLPLGIVLALLFTVLMMAPKMNSWILGLAGNVRHTSGSVVRSSAGFEGGFPSYSLIAVATSIAYTGALLFTVIAAHARLRSQFPDAGLLYLEYFYFVAYLAIIAIALNALAFAAHRGGGLVHYRDNLLPRVAFWPLITGYLFTVTFLTFH